MPTVSCNTRLPLTRTAGPHLALQHSFGLAMALTALACMLSFAAASPALSHEAPKGWNYPFSCCSGFDCREVSSKQVSEKPEGYVIKGTGEVVTYTDARLKDSPDGEYHWCSVAGADDSRTICLFVPPRSY